MKNLVGNYPFILNLRTLLIATLFGVSVESTAALQRGACVDRPDTTFKELVKQQKPREIVFFASWCVACQKHLVESNPMEAVYVVAFDETDPAQKALFSQFPREMWQNIWCEADQLGEIRRRYHVSQLPKTIKLDVYRTP